MRTDRYNEIPQKQNRRGLKILLIVILLLLVAAAAGAGAAYHAYNRTLDSLAISFTDDGLTVEFGGDYPAMEYVGVASGDVTAAETFLDAESVGEKELVYTVSKPMFGGLLTPSKEFTFTYTVVDSVAPVVLSSGSGMLIEIGTELDIRDYIAYGDNADPAPVLDIKGEVDTEESGEYTLNATVTDASGNATEWEIYVEVSDPEDMPEYSDETEKTKFKKFVSKHKGEGRSFGIDVSSWQGDVDFEKVKAAGCDFVIIRIGYSSDGELTFDNEFEKNYEKAKAAGIKIGLYLYSYDSSPGDVRASARTVIDALGGDRLDLPIAFDWEDFGSFQSYGMSFRDLNKLYDAFADELSAGGYDCMLYGSSYYLERVWEHTDVRPVWLAHYTDETDYGGPYLLWQASCTGKISGIDGDVDLDIMYSPQA